jgi:hypothetical protein
LLVQKEGVLASSTASNDSGLVVPRSGSPSRHPRQRFGGAALSPRRLAAAIVANFGFWAVAVVHEWIVRGPFIDLGGDWARFWGAARAFEAVKPGAGYQLPQIAAFMQPLARYVNAGAGGVRPGPAPYPPVFLDAFAVLTGLPPLTGFALWTALNAGLALVIAIRLAASFRSRAPWLTTLALAGYFPVMLALFAGQIEIVLLACLMQAIFAFSRGNEHRAGIWLGLLLLKPQYAALILLVPLVKRRWAALGGVALSAAGLLLGSLATGGLAGVLAYVHELMTAYPAYGGSVGIDPRGMIGWRGLTATALPFLAAGPSLALVAGLSALTLAPLVAIWRGPWDPTSPRFARQLTATVAATLLIAYHSQPHGAALLLAPGALVVASAETSRPLRAALLALAVGGPAVGLISALAFGTLWLIGPATTLALATALAAIFQMERATPAQAEVRPVWVVKRSPRPRPSWEMG